MNKICNRLKKMKINDSKVIYQERKSYRPCSKSCFVRLLKPLIGADDWIYSCRGIYSMQKIHLSMIMTKICAFVWQQISLNFVKKQIPFDGSLCEKYYHAEYNDLLDILLFGIKHKKFVWFLSRKAGYSATK